MLCEGGRRQSTAGRFNQSSDTAYNDVHTVVRNEAITQRNTLLLLQHLLPFGLVRWKGGHKPTDIRALWRSVLSTRAPECQQLKLVG